MLKKPYAYFSFWECSVENRLELVCVFVMSPLGRIKCYSKNVYNRSVLDSYIEWREGMEKIFRAAPLPTWPIVGRMIFKKHAGIGDLYTYECSTQKTLWAQTMTEALELAWQKTVEEFGVNRPHWTDIEGSEDLIDLGSPLKRHEKKEQH